MQVGNQTESSPSITPVFEQDIMVLTDKSLQLIGIGNIEIKKGFNPRRYFAPKAMAELVKDIASRGIIQPIVVRPNSETSGYWVVAGERRYRAAKEAKLDLIPCVIRLLDDAEASAMAVAENTVRDDMSPAEESRTAHKVITLVDGDKDEAAKLLGWSDTKLKARLSLLHCTEAVLEALEQRKILIGHAELLATLPHPTQDGTVKAVIEKAISVSDLKSRIAGFARDLTDVVFSTDECNTCPHNSVIQQSLFETHIESGKCANPTCFSEKTQSALTTKKGELAEKYPVIFLDTEKVRGSYALVIKQGDGGIGSEQFIACQQCANFGVLMDSSPGNEGKLSEDVCFDRPCHNKKLAAYKKQLKDAATKTKSQTTQKPSNKAKTSAQPSASPKKVIEEVDRFYRDLSQKVVATHDKASRAITLFALWKDAGTPAEIGKPYHIKGTSRSQVVEALYQLNEEESATLEADLVSHLVSKTESGYGDSQEFVNTSKTLVKITNTSLVGHFTLNEAFLKSHTKAGIEGVLKEAGFDTWFTNENDEKAFPKLIKMKVDDLIKKVLTSGYDFSQFVPKTIRG